MTNENALSHVPCLVALKSSYVCKLHRIRQIICKNVQASK